MDTGKKACNFLPSNLNTAHCIVRMTGSRPALEGHKKTSAIYYGLTLSYLALLITRASEQFSCFFLCLCFACFTSGRTQPSATLYEMAAKHGNNFCFESPFAFGHSPKTNHLSMSNPGFFLHFFLASSLLKEEARILKYPFLLELFGDSCSFLRNFCNNGSRSRAEPDFVRKAGRQN